MKNLIIIAFIFVYCLGYSQPKFSDSTIYISYYNETVYGDNKTHQPEVTFGFEGNLIVTSMDGQFSRFRSHGITDKGEDRDHIWEIHKCKDNSGTDVSVALALELESNTNIIIIHYSNMYMFFEVTAHKIPEEVFDVMNEVGKNGYLYDGNFGSDYTNEEVMEFLRMFGDPRILINAMLYDLYFNN